MDDDACCLFIIIACLLSLVIPSAGQVIFAVFAFALSLAALLAQPADTAHHQQHHDQQNVPGR